MAAGPPATQRPYNRASKVLPWTWTWKMQPTLPNAGGNAPPNPKFYQPPHPAATCRNHASFYPLRPANMAVIRQFRPVLPQGTSHLGRVRVRAQHCCAPACPGIRHLHGGVFFLLPTARLAHFTPSLSFTVATSLAHDSQTRQSKVVFPRTNPQRRPKNEA